MQQVVWICEDVRLLCDKPAAWMELAGWGWLTVVSAVQMCLDAMSAHHVSPQYVAGADHAIQPVWVQGAALCRQSWVLVTCYHSSIYLVVL